MGHKLPTILQTEVSECGLACVTMIARYWGHNVDLTSLRQKFQISMKGASLRSLMTMANTLELAPRPLRLEMENLNELQLPAILHWDLNHFVVLKSIKSDKVQIIDPAIGLKTISMSRVSKHFTGVALELSPTTEFSAIDNRLTPHIHLLWNRLVGLKRALFQTLTLSLILQIIVLAMPFYLQVVVDGVLPQTEYGLLTALLIGFGALAVLRALAEATRSYAILIYGNQMSLQMVGNVFRHLIRLPTSYFEKRHVGDIISRMNSTIPIQEALTQSVVGILIDGVMAILMLIVMWIYSPWLAIVVLVSVAILALITLFLYPSIRRTQEESIYKRAEENTHVIESIRASTTIKLFGRESTREAAWRNLYANFINANVAYGRYIIAQRFAETLIIGLQLIVVVYVAAKMMMTDNATFSVGMLLAFLAYRQYFTDSVTQLLEKGIEFRLLTLHLDRLSDVIFTEQEEQSAIYSELGDIEGHIKIEDLNFRYSPMDPWILKNLSLDIAAGNIVTLTGKSGGGKTTLLKLIMGLYEADSGHILIDGKSLSDIGRRNWRQHIGVVMQDDQLLSGTISDNISFFDPEIDMHKVHQAAKMARIHDEIMAIPMDYNSMVGDMGSILSGGQQQRVLLARALYHEPSVLFLDEGTSNLDIQTEQDIVDVIASLSITRVIVAHRPAFIQASDQVIEI